MTEPGRRRWLVWLGYPLGAVAVYYAVRHAGLGLNGFVQALAALAPWQWLVCLLLFAVHVGMNAAAYTLLMRGIELPVERAPRIYRKAWLGSLLAKYVPGGIWQVAGRSVLLGRHGVPARAVVLSGVFEQLVSLGWCLAIAFAAAAWVHGWRVSALALLVIASATCFVVPSMAARIAAARALNRSGTAIALYGLAMLPYTAGYLVLLLPADSGLAVMALFAGTIAGLVSFFSPGGLGVRESVTALMAGQSATGATLAAMTAARMLMLAVEAAASAGGLILLNRRGS